MDKIFFIEYFSKDFYQIRFFFQVPELAGFLLLTLLPQTPLLCFLLLYRSLIVMPLEYALHPMLLFMIIVEVIVSILTVRSMAHRQATKFHMQKFVDLERISATDDHYDTTTARVVLDGKQQRRKYEWVLVFLLNWIRRIQRWTFCLFYIKIRSWLFSVQSFIWQILMTELF